MKYPEVGPNDLEIIVKNIRQDLEGLKEIVEKEYLSRGTWHRDKNKKFDPSKLRLDISIEVFDPYIITPEDMLP